MKVRFKKELYSVKALFKAAYHFTDCCYVFIDSTEDEYIVSIESKDQQKENLEELFINEVLTQETRIKVHEDTADLRKMILARAFASTIIEDNTVSMNGVTEEDGDDVFEPWG